MLVQEYDVNEYVSSSDEREEAERFRPGFAPLTALGRKAAAKGKAMQF